MSDFNNDTQKNGELNGFDSVDSKPVQNGYTVTPEGGFYTRAKEDIIQDDISPEPDAYYAETVNDDSYTPPKEEKKGEQPPRKSDYFPSGEYGNYGSNSQSYTPPVNNYSYNAGQQNYGYTTPKKEKKGVNAAVVAIIAVLVFAIGATVGGVVLFSVSGKPQKSTKTDSVNQTSQNVNINIDETAETVVEAVAKKVTPSVIGIRTTTSVTSFFGGSSEATGEGSGVVYTADGYIITNYHVIAGASEGTVGSKIEVFVDDLNSKPYEAAVIGYNIASDLAVIKIDADNLTPVEFTDSSSLKVGQYVITVGNPGGLEFMDSVTYGVVSGLNRVVSASSDVKLIQTDAAINPGNSGGALVNAKGQLVGINSSKIVSEEFEGMGFAIPSNSVKQICQRIIEKQNEPEPYIGITISEKYTANVLKYSGFPTGAVISSVAEGSPADKAGLERADIITEFGGKKINDYTVLVNLIEDCSPNDKINIKLYRNGRYYTTTLTVGSNNAVK